MVGSYFPWPTLIYKYVTVTERTKQVRVGGRRLPGRLVARMCPVKRRC